MKMIYPALEYQVLDLFNHLPNFSDRWNLKQDFKKSNIQICKENLKIQFCGMSSAPTKWPQ